MKIKHKVKNISSKNMRDSLTLACCTLLQATPDAHAELLEDIKVDSAVLVYSESDGRVSLIKPIVKLKTELEEDEFLNIQLAFDTLSGATPTGAQATNIAQTFTRPSGKGTYTIAPGEMPLDDTFKDSRLSISASLEKPIDRLSKNIYSASFSTEFDWLSFSGGYSYSLDSTSRDITYTLGASLTSDSISPKGGAPIAFETMKGSGDDSSKAGDESRNTIDFIAGFTKVLNRKTITQLNFSHSQSNGYHNDPYKILSVIDDVTGELTTTPEYRYEKRPDSRHRNIIYWKTVHHLTEDVINIAYRYYQDDWDINSHTIDLKYRYELSNKNFLQPHIRYYSQTAANFYRHSLLVSEISNLPEFASADPRLAEFNTLTIGLKYSHKLGPNETISARVEVMTQTGDSSPADAIGEQQQQDLYPDLTATIIQVSYSFTW